MTGVNLSPKPPPGEWAERANCIGLPASWFFPSRDEPDNHGDAKAVCAACCVREECLEYAMLPPLEKVGRWGGTSGRDRLRLARQRRAAS